MTPVKACGKRESLFGRLRRAFGAARGDQGGYAMITVIIICAIVIGVFVTATLLIVEQSYTAQERQFARQVELLQAQGNLEAARAEIEAWASDTDPVELSEFTEDKIKEKISSFVDVKSIEAISPVSVDEEDSTKGTATKSIIVESKQGTAKIETKIEMVLGCTIEEGNIKTITSIKTGYTSYKEALG